MKRAALTAALVLAILLGAGFVATNLGAGAGAERAAAPVRPAAEPRPAAPPSTPAPSGSPSPTPSGSLSSGPPTLPGVSTVDTTKLTELPFEVPLPTTWSCEVVPKRLDGQEYDCADNPDKITSRLRLLWRNCPNGCGRAKRAIFGMDWQAEWFGDIRRLPAYGPNVAALETNSTLAYTYSVSKFMPRGQDRFQLVLTVDGAPAHRALLRAIGDAAVTASENQP